MNIFVISTPTSWYQQVYFGAKETCGLDLFLPLSPPLSHELCPWRERKSTTQCLSETSSDRWSPESNIIFDWQIHPPKTRTTPLALHDAIFLNVNVIRVYWNKWCSCYSCKRIVSSGNNMSISRFSDCSCELAVNSKLQASWVLSTKMVEKHNRSLL